MTNTILKSFIFISTFMYGAIFVYSYTSPQSIEKHASGFIKTQIEKKTREKIDNFGSKYKDNKLINLSKQVLKKQNAKLQAYKLALQNKLHTTIATIVTSMQNADSERRERYSTLFKGIIISNITKLSLATQNLKEFMHHKYMYIVQNIISDFRIFAGSNFFILLILFILLFTKPDNINQINLLVGLMFISIFISSYLYIFEQNWFYTVIYSDFIGFLYFGYLGIVFLLLLDIIFNKAHITTTIVDFILNAIGSFFSSLST